MKKVLLLLFTLNAPLTAQKVTKDRVAGIKTVKQKRTPPVRSLTPPPITPPSRPGTPTPFTPDTLFPLTGPHRWASVPLKVPLAAIVAGGVVLWLHGDKPAAVIPEPSTVVLLLAGAVSLLLVRRKA